jgi:amino acid transporter
MPLNALALVCSICVILALIYIASSTAYNAIISLSALALNISYIIPITFVMISKVRGRQPGYGPFRLGYWGIPVNVFALAYLIFIIIWMPFPGSRPVTLDTMNYSGPIFIVVVIWALIDWCISGHKRFKPHERVE